MHDQGVLVVQDSFPASKPARALLQSCLPLSQESSDTIGFDKSDFNVIQGNAAGFYGAGDGCEKT